MSSEFVSALAQLEREKGIAKGVLIETIEAALVSAYKKNFGIDHSNITATVDSESGDFKVFETKTIRAEVEDPELELDLKELQEINPDFEDGDVVEIEVTPKQFGRIAAQTAKQVVTQRIREAERFRIVDEYTKKIGKIVTGVIRRAERKTLVLDLGKDAVGYIEPKELIMGEDYLVGKRMKCIVLNVNDDSKGPRIMLSRTHPELVKKLFEFEVPEIANGLVEIKAVAREAGYRSKIAVSSKDINVDPVGACVGQKGIRVQAVVDELKGEKIDIIPWNPSPEIFISNSLSPAEALRVDITGTDSVCVIVPDDQLSLAIGKEGQNVRLAARLTNWRIDIKDESTYRDMMEEELFDTTETLHFDENGNPISAQESNFDFSTEVEEVNVEEKDDTEELRKLLSGKADILKNDSDDD